MAFARARVASSSAHLSWTSCACVAARKGGRRRARGCRDRGLQHGPIGRSIATVEVAVEAVDIDRMARARRRLRRRLRPRLLSARGSVDWFTGRFFHDALRELEDESLGGGHGACVTACAAFLGDLELVRLARDCGHEWDAYTCAFAAYSGNLECLKYAHEHGCPWNKSTCACTAYTGHLGCLKYGRMVHGVDVESHASTSGPTRSASARTHALRSRTGLPFSQCSATHAHPLSSTYASRCTPSIDSSPHAGLLTWIYAPGGVKKRVSHPRARSANASPRR